jgi:hypothetical protein
MFCITNENKLAVSESDTATNKPFPRFIRVARNLVLEDGVIPAGAIAQATLVLAYGEPALSLRFEQWWRALARWDNELLLFPTCVDFHILDCLQVFIT